jgi:hypothetical protein
VNGNTVIDPNAATVLVTSTYLPVPPLIAFPIYRTIPQLRGPEKPNITIGPAPEFLGLKQADCLDEAFKGAGKDFTGLSTLDDLSTFLAGGDASQFASLSYAATGAKRAAGAVAGSMAAKTAIRAALREDGTKVSVKAVGKAATKVGKFTGYVGGAITLGSAYLTYKRCMAQ